MGLPAPRSACGSSGSDFDISPIKSPEKQFRTAATTIHMPNKYVVTVTESECSCLLKSWLE